jgi:hypothetical protein
MAARRVDGASLISIEVGGLTRFSFLSSRVRATLGDAGAASRVCSLVVGGFHRNMAVARWVRV